MPAIDRSYGFYQIAKYNYFPGWHQQSTTNEVLFNRAAWEKLEKPQQAMFSTACMANIGVELAEGEALQPAAMLANVADGVTNVSWSDEVLDTIREKWEEVLAEELAANPDVQTLWDSYTKFNESYKIWGEMGYLK